MKKIVLVFLPLIASVACSGNSAGFSDIDDGAFGCALILGVMFSMGILWAINQMQRGGDDE